MARARIISILVVLLSAAHVHPAPGADQPAAADPPAGSGPLPMAAGAVFTLDQFGSVQSPPEAQAALEAAAARLRAGGGVVIIPAAAARSWTPINTFQTFQEPAGDPAAAQPAGPGLTLIDIREGTVKILPPPATGLRLERALKLPEGQSLPHWDYFPLLALENVVARGSTSYRDQVLEDVAAGADARLFVNTIRGLFPGMFVNLHSKKLQRIHVKSLGYDADRGRWYVVADLVADVRKGDYLSNKNHVNILRAMTSSHVESQTSDLRVWRDNYSQGDNYLVDARFKYMGDVHSTGGDENGVIYGAFIESLTNVFRGEVDRWDPRSGSLVFRNARNAETLGSGRPVINLNPTKWITAGRAWIVRPASFTEPSGATTVNPVFRGRAYPTEVAPGADGGESLVMGGLIRLSADAPVDATVVGRYFAVDEADEYVPGTKDLRRWYLVDKVVVHGDGTKDLRIVRHWWGATSAGAPTLYKPDNYSAEGRERPLRFVIAPGANAYDVADALPGKQVNADGGQRLIRLAPAPTAGGSAVAYEPGDAIEQAIGPDPFRPAAFRSWLFEKVPGVFPAAVFDIANLGAVQRSTVLLVKGGTGDAARDMAERYDRGTPWDEVIRFDAACRTGIAFKGDTTTAAIEFQQPHGRPQPIKWAYDGGRKHASLAVDPATGTLGFDGDGIDLHGGVAGLAGISATPTPARNLRGISLPVRPGSREVVVAFPKPEADDQYAVFVETNWLTARAVVSQTARGFTVQFDPPAGQNATLDWLVVR